MKRWIVIVLFAALVIAAALACPGAETQKEPGKDNLYVTRTYTLKHITPLEVAALEAYYVKRSFARGGRMITLVLRRDLVGQFEKLLARLDQPRRSVQLQMYTLVASRTQGPPPDLPGGLRQVLEELTRVLAFRSYRLDGTSALMAREGQRYATLRLSSAYDLAFHLKNLSISESGEEPRQVQFEFALDGPLSAPAKPGAGSEKPARGTLISSNVSLQEKGYLVAGVSRLGDNGDSLVLILHCAIR